MSKRRNVETSKEPQARGSPVGNRCHRRHNKRWGWFIVVLVLTAPILVELALRLPGIGPVAYKPRRFEPDGRVPFLQFSDGKSVQVVYQPNASFASVYDTSGDRRGYFGVDGRIVYRLNMFGMRGPDVAAAKSENEYRILCLGDSITFGEGVREEDTYPVQLQKLLANAMPGKKVEAINQGVQGYGTKEGVNAYYLAGISYKPDLVIVGFYLNDATDFGETIRQNDAKNREIELTGWARFSKIGEVLQRRSRARVQQEEFFDTTRKSFQSAHWQACRDALLKLRGEAERWKFKLVITVFPVLWELDHYPLEDVHKMLHETFKELGIANIDLLDTFRGRDAESLWVHPTDQHPNEIAHRMAAEKIAEYLAAERPHQ